MYKPEYVAQKFRNLMLYLAHLSREDPHFGAVKLNKLLYYCDFIAFSRLGKPITGADYQKLTEGPAPVPMVLERKHLIDQGLAKLEHRRYFRYVQQRLVPDGDQSALAEEFTREEIGIISEVHEAMLPMTAREASETSHRELGWILAELHANIPYETAVLGPAEDYEADAMFAASEGDNQ